MKTKLTITDLTRMQEQRVCVAGYDEQGRCVRPVLPPPGILECSLYAAGKPFVFPFAVVEYELIQETPLPPHTEDALFDPASVRGCGSLDGGAAQDLLRHSLSGSVAALFEQPILADGGFYVMDGGGPRSLGTVQPQGPVEALFQVEAAGALKPRLRFTDGAGATYKLAVTDLAWRYCAEWRQRGELLTPDALAERFGAALRGKEVFLRIGLARGWSQHPDRCYLQVTGIHTFPDYLEGRTFADFAPEVEEDDW